MLPQDPIPVKHKLGKRGKHKEEYEMVPAFKMVGGGEERLIDKDPLNKSWSAELYTSNNKGAEEVRHM